MSHRRIQVDCPRTWAADHTQAADVDLRMLVTARQDEGVQVASQGEACACSSSAPPTTATATVQATASASTAKVCGWTSNSGFGSDSMRVGRTQRHPKDAADAAIEAHSCPRPECNCALVRADRCGYWRRQQSRRMASMLRRTILTLCYTQSIAVHTDCWPSACNLLCCTPRC